MESISLGDLRAAIVVEASIQGQTGASGRHPTSDLNKLINRYCRSARSLAADSGEPWYQVVGAITALPAPTAGEDFIEVAFPTTAIEILGVDVSSEDTSTVNFDQLDPADWKQRRLLNASKNYPPSGRGWWAVKDMPDARGAAAITAGTIALFPSTLAGNYRVAYREQFTDMADDTHLFVGIEPMFTWVINMCVLTIIKGDNNKKANYQAAQMAVDKAEARILRATKRAARVGSVVPVRRGGDPW